MDPQPGGPDWMKITPKAGSLFREKSHQGQLALAPVSKPMRSASGARLRINSAGAPSADFAVPSKTERPCSSMTQTEVSPRGDNPGALYSVRGGVATRQGGHADCEDQNAALEDRLKVCRRPENGQAVETDGKDEYADKRADDVKLPFAQRG